MPTFDRADLTGAVDRAAATGERVLLAGDGALVDLVRDRGPDD